MKNQPRVQTISQLKTTLKGGEYKGVSKSPHRPPKDGKIRIDGVSKSPSHEEEEGTTVVVKKGDKRNKVMGERPNRFNDEEVGKGAVNRKNSDAGKLLQRRKKYNQKTSNNIQTVNYFNDDGEIVENEHADESTDGVFTRLLNFIKSLWPF